MEERDQKYQVQDNNFLTKMHIYKKIIRYFNNNAWNIWRWWIIINNAAPIWLIIIIIGFKIIPQIPVHIVLVMCRLFLSDLKC